MGGRKSQELSHINYTEILKQCLAAVGVFNLLVTGTSVSNPYSSNPDPAKNLNPDPGRP